MSNNKIEIPHVQISHWEQISSEFFDDFLLDVSAEKLRVSVDARQDTGIYAGLEWLIPTVIVTYIARSYFDGFLGEMGRDHYLALKSALAKLTIKATSLKVSIAASAGKVSKHQPYSLAYSIFAEANDRHVFKFMIQIGLTEPQSIEATGAFLEFLDKYYSGSLDNSANSELKSAHIAGRTILLAYNFETQRIVVLDPMSGHRSNKPHT